MKAGGKTDHPSLSASFYHSDSGLLIEVEEDNDRIYPSTHSLSLALFPLCGIIHPHTSSPLSPLSIIPSTHQPGRVYLMTQAITFFLFFFSSLPPEPRVSRAEPEHVCVRLCFVFFLLLCVCVSCCVSVCVCVSMCVISSGLAALTWAR